MRVWFAVYKVESIDVIRGIETDTLGNAVKLGMALGEAASKLLGVEFVFQGITPVFPEAHTYTEEQIVAEGSVARSFKGPPRK